jgi:hypothetical protein
MINGKQRHGYAPTLDLQQAAITTALRQEEAER